jgi:helicase
MKLSQLQQQLPPQLYDAIKQEISELRPAQAKAIKSGLLDGNNLLVCTPTASGKTLIAELASVTAILNKKGKAVYIVPLKSLATEKYKDFKKRYSRFVKIALSIGDIDSSDSYLADYDLIICTAEKLDSLLRHHSPWISLVSVVVVDEVHLLNDVERGPTLEILITMLRQLLKNVQLIALSATIGNPEELAKWLDAKLILDSWRPVKLSQGIYFRGEVELK